MISSGQYLFVYGSLRKPIGHPQHQILERSAGYIGEGIFRGKLYMVNNYPAAVKSEQAEDRVTGEIYRLQHPRKTFRKLDYYEGYDAKNRSDSLFIRVQEEVSLIESGSRIKTWIYLYNRPVSHLKRIPTGDYLKYLSSDHS